MKQNLLTLGLILFLIPACGFITDEQDLVTNGVKRISPYLHDGSSENAYLQNEYRIGPTSRLLIRREDMLEKRHQLVVDSTHPVKLGVHVTNAGDRPAALGALKLCSLEKNWMMLATWYAAHPFAASGKWRQAGGDFHSDSCLSGQADAQASTLIIFDVTDIIETRLISLGEAYGFVLLSDTQEIEIVGDAHPSRSPRMSWTEIKGIFSTTHDGSR